MYLHQSVDGTQHTLPITSPHQNVQTSTTSGIFLKHIFQTMAFIQTENHIHTNNHIRFNPFNPIRFSQIHFNHIPPSITFASIMFALDTSLSQTDDKLVIQRFLWFKSQVALIQTPPWNQPHYTIQSHTGTKPEMTNTHFTEDFRFRWFNPHWALIPQVVFQVYPNTHPNWSKIFEIKAEQFPYVPHIGSSLAWIKFEMSRNDTCKSFQPGSAQVYQESIVFAELDAVFSLLTSSSLVPVWSEPVLSLGQD